MGDCLIIPRETYKYDMYEPLTFDQLSWVAHRNIFRAATKRNGDGSYSANEAFFYQRFFDPKLLKYYGGTVAGIDSFVVKNCNNQYKFKLSPKEIEATKQEMRESVRPHVPPQGWLGRIFNHKKFD